jgi:hypothetical protein
VQFSRPVTLGDGSSRDAVFRTVVLNQSAVAGRLYFCHHFTRDLVWRDEWRHHANGTVGVVRTLIASDDPSRLGAVFAAMFGAATVRKIPGGISLVVGLSRVDVLDHATIATTLGAAARSDDRPEYMAALTLRTLSLSQAEAALSGVTLVRAPGRLLVPAAAAFGCVLEFVE